MVCVTRFAQQAVACFQVLCVAALIISLGACSSSGRSYTSGKMTETLETEILPNASKMFVYRLRWPEEAIPEHIRVARSTRSEAAYEQHGVDVNRNSYERLQANTGYVVEQMGYCREGFLELDSSVSRYHLWMKGECRESATSADRQRFGEQKTLPVKLGR